MTIILLLEAVRIYAIFTFSSMNDLGILAGRDLFSNQRLVTLYNCGWQHLYVKIQW